MSKASSNPNGFHSIVVTGGGGYVGSALVPTLLDRGYKVKVIDTFWYGHDVFGAYGSNPGLSCVQMDIRDARRLRNEVANCDALIHLACISNDPSVDLNPALGKSINYDAFGPLLDCADAQGVKRFIFASSASIYGVKDQDHVREDAEPAPLTDYARFKLACERDLLAHRGRGDMDRVMVRPAAVCGYARRLRLDLAVNILTANALVNRRIRVFGGGQRRPNINVNDMVRVYHALLDAPSAKIDRQAFNAGYQNNTVDEIAAIVKSSLGDEGIEIAHEDSADKRSYHINSDKITDVLGFTTRYTIEDAVESLAQAFDRNLVHDPLNNPLYINIKRMQELGIS